MRETLSWCESRPPSSVQGGHARGSVNLKGKVAIVTGGASGIGRATVLALAKAGAAVVVADINGAGAQLLVDELRSGDHEGLAISTDVSLPSQLQTMIAQAASRFGRIDILVNNAADLTLLADDKDLLSTDIDVWERTYRSNQQSVMVASKYVLPHMLARRSGVIVNISSVDALLGETTRFAYGMSKAAIDLLTQCVATTYGPCGIRCNSVLPGLVMTPMAQSNIGPLERRIWERNVRSDHLGAPAEIASVVVFLASEAASYINGQAIRVDGALLSHVPHLAQFEQEGGFH
jgi:NAD(P)-dependent dehydrogenase (short-subunit alcohol dehydrogenase family)